MKVYIENLPEKLKKGAEIFCRRYGVEYAVGGKTLKVQLSLDDKISVSGDTIFYKKEVDIFRLLCKWIEAKKKGGSLSLTETRKFETFGVMLDLSRNEVMHVGGICEYITYMAGFGADRIMLYIEDTYEVKGYPYMGYFRGRYTAEELNEIDKYASLFGIETIACIQTLGHMERFLRWYTGMRDTANVLLCDDEKTYEFIEKCIKVIADNISSPYIHIGMDEAFNLGGGRYKSIFGEIDSGELFVKHLNKVCEICEKIGKKPVIWGDMLVVVSSQTGNCVDEKAVIRPELVEKLPKNVEIVYWDYYSIRPSRYENMLDVFAGSERKVWFAGGIWTWETFTYGDMRTKLTTEVALKACLKKGIKDVFATSWVNPGGFCPLISGLYGVAVWSALVFDSENASADKDFETVTGDKGEYFSYMTNIDAPEIMPGQDLTCPDQQPSSAVMSFLFQSILCGLFDTITEGYDLTSYYKKVADNIAKFESENFSDMYKHFEIMSRALSIKANAGNIIYKAYHENDKETLKDMADNKLSELVEYMKQLIETHRTIWNKYNKPYGFDVVRNHYAGVIADCIDTKMTISEYLSGKIEFIDQLEQERLEYMHPFSKNETGFISDVGYNNVYTTCRG